MRTAREATHHPWRSTTDAFTRWTIRASRAPAGTWRGGGQGQPDGVRGVGVRMTVRPVGREEAGQEVEAWDTTAQCPPASAIVHVLVEM
jgi:hypothetical protein